MVALFNVWNFYLASEFTGEFDVTLANMPRVESGTHEWIATCLAAMGVNAAVKDWEIKPLRCAYYSDYVDSPNWQDRWPETWIVSVRFEQAVQGFVNRLFTAPIAVDAPDTTWSHDGQVPSSEFDALLIGSYEGEAIDLHVLVRQLLDGAKEQGISEDRLTYSIRRLGGRWQQLRLSMLHLDVENDLQIAEGLLSDIEASGGVVNWRYQ